MSSKTRKKRGRHEISEESPASAAEQPPLPPPLPVPSLPNDILWKIVLFSEKHLRLRLVSSSWNHGVIDAHCNPDCRCKNCECKSSLNQFTFKRILLPWISKWKFASYFSASPSLLTDMMFEKQQNGVQTLRTTSSFGGRGIAPITHCVVEVSPTVFDEFVSVFSTAQVEHITNLVLSGFDFWSANAAIKKRAVETVGKLKNLEKFEISHWRFDYPGGKDDFHLLASSFPHLKTLSLQRRTITDPCLAVFASPSSSGLVSLSIVPSISTRLTAAAIRDSISLSPYLTNLAHLDLSDTKCGDDVVVPICQSRTFTSIRALILHNCNLHDASIEAMASTPWMKNLTHLQIPGNHISAIGLTRLFASAGTPDAPFSRLSILNCGENSEILGNALKSEVARVFRPLSVLRMPQREADLELTIGDDSTFDRKAVEALTNIPFMKFARTLKLSSSADACSSIFSPSSQFCSVQNLQVATPSIAWQPLKALVSSSLAKNLRTLILNSHLDPDDVLTEHLDDDCCAVIADSEPLGNLQSLSFGQPHMSLSVGLIRLLSSPNLSPLKHLDCNFDGGSLEYESAETMSESDAAQHISQLLQSTATGLKYLGFPNTEFAENVKMMVEEKVESVTLE